MRQPLRDLPLDTFVLLEQRTSTKRPLSPSATLLSPSKRRILSAEGLYSPQKKRTLTPSRHLFSEFVGSPPSPSRKPEFAALSHPTPRKASIKPTKDASPRPETPVSRTGKAPRLAPSPEIASSSASGASTSYSRCDPTLAYPRATTIPPPMLIPREMPTFSDRQTVHWPGFDVHPDTYIAIPTSCSVAHAYDVTDVDDVDDTKENVKPRKRAGKRLVSDGGKAGKTPKLSRTEKHNREPGGANMMSTFTPSPGSKSLTPHERQQERRHMRLIMVHEQDGQVDEEQDVEQQL